jgi:predicted S18 family serine protease
MSLGRRAYDILRGTLNAEWDRIHQVIDDPASNELAESLTNPSPKFVAQPEAKPQEAQTPESKAELARKILGVAETASFQDIRQAFERINKRADPSNFPAETPESAQAAQIQRRVQWAYAVLTETMDVTEKRFRSLEIE